MSSNEIYRTTRSRRKGQYYEAAWDAAVQTNPRFVSVTSFNEWHEGTQIETAVPAKTSNFTYLDYSPHQPDHYLKLTRDWVKKYISEVKVKA